MPDFTAEQRAAADRLRSVLVHLKLAAGMAVISTGGGEPGLAIIGKNLDGKGGRVTAEFECKAFLADLELVVGADVVDGPHEDPRICPECGGTQEVYLGDLSNHKPGCSRFPL